jgi:glycosyltransferase involved in cell wall biosynthesis
VHWVVYGAPAEWDFGVPVHDLSRGAVPRGLASKWHYLLSGLQARRLFRRLRPDVVHGHYVTSAGVVCLLAGYRPYILTAHGSDLLVAGSSPLWRPVLKRAFRRSAMLNTVSQELTDKARSLGVPAERLLLSTLGIDLGRFPWQARAAPAGPVRLVCTRMLDDLYDPWTILEACRILRERQVPFRLTFAANGPLEPAVRERIRAEGLAECVTLLGGYRNQDLPAILAGHDVFISASRWDGTSICLLEAMACGLVPVMSRIPSNLAWLEDGRTAAMFDCGDAEGLARAVAGVAARFADWGIAVRENRRVVEARADRRDNMLRLEEWYDRVAAGTARENGTRA